MPVRRAALVTACTLGLFGTAAHAQAPSGPGEPQAEPAGDGDGDGDEFGATARLSAPEPSRARALSAEEVRTMRRRMGDSFNVAEAQPGTVPVFSGVPYLLVRGAPPAGTSLYYDGVPVPWLFHLALGPAITHPALLGDLELHHGVAPARYGRRTGAVFSARGPGSMPKLSEGELGIRLLDTQALFIGGTAPTIAAHGRMGYPELMLELIDSDAVLSYWDYQLRAQHQLQSGDELTVAAFGAYDRIGDRRDPRDDIALQFHRLLLRLRRTAGDVEIGGSLYLGYETGVLGQELTAKSGRAGPSLYVEHTPSRETRVRVGADMEAKLAQIDRGPGKGPLDPFAPPGDGSSFLPSLGSNFDLEIGPEDFIDLAPLAKVEERNAAGAYAELTLLPARAVAVETGVRADVWVAAGQVQHAVDPRALLRVRVLPGLALHAGIGRTHQAPVSPLPIPGLSDFELDRGLQSALQTEAGAALDLPHQFKLSMTGFYHRFSNLVFMELIVDCRGNTDPMQPFVFERGAARSLTVCERPGLPRADGQAYGVEWLLKRELTRKFTGWASYTLGWADARAEDGTEFRPQYDVRHLLNLVLGCDFGGGWDGGLMLHFRSGKPAVNTLFDFAQQRFEHIYSRLPPFFRADVNAGYRWQTSFGRMGVMFQFLNVTFSREATKRDCRLDSRLEVVCEVDRQPAIVLPNAGVRAEF
jgi:hypothetical protein